MIIDEIRAFADNWEEDLLDCRLRHEAWLDRAWQGEASGAPALRLPADLAESACGTLLEILLEPIEDEELSERLEEMQRRLLPWQIDPAAATAWALKREELLGLACRQMLSPSPESREALARDWQELQIDWRSLAEKGGFTDGGELRRQMLQIDASWLNPLREQLKAILQGGALQEEVSRLAPELEVPQFSPAREMQLCRDLLDLLGLDPQAPLESRPLECMLPLCRRGLSGTLLRPAARNGLASRLDLLGRALLPHLGGQEASVYADEQDPLPRSLGRLLANRLADPAWCRLLDLPEADGAGLLPARRVARLLRLLELQEGADAGELPQWPSGGLPPELCGLEPPLELALVSELLALFLQHALAGREEGTALGSPTGGGLLQEWVPPASGGGWPRLLRELAPPDPGRLFPGSAP